MSETASRQGASSAGLTLPWPALSLALGVVAVGSLGTLAVVATLGQVDALSTVALALAILAFTAQIVVTLSQAHAAAVQQTQVARVNTETRKLLAEISTQSEALLVNQRETFARVLEVALGSGAIKEAVSALADESAVDDSSEETTPDSGIDADALAERLEQNLKSAFAGFAAESLQIRRGPVKLTTSPERYRSYVEEAESYPPEELGTKALETFRKLTPLEVAALARRAIADLQRAKNGLPPQGWTLESSRRPSTQRLVDLGLMEFKKGKVRGNKDGWIRTLTPSGRQVARFITARGKPPEYLLRQTE